MIQPPSTLRRLGESRAFFELGAFMAASPMLRLAGRGDRHPILVLPGFTASDRSTEPLRWVLRSQGYWTHGWRLGTNLGPTQRVIDGLHERIEHLRGRHGRTISLIGWSLGGIYAREFARLHPDEIRQVITLGSPFRMTLNDRSAASNLVDKLSDRFNAETLGFALAEADKAPLPVPSTAIYSRDDGVVRWHTCIDVESDLHENVEVRGSHSGLGWNPAAVYAISDRLAQPEDHWRRFRAPLTMRHLYPRPATWADQRAS